MKLSVKQGRIKFHFLKVFGMTRPGIEPRSPGLLVITLPTRPSLLMSKSIVESARVEVVRQFLYQLDPNTRKIARRLEKLQLKMINSVPLSFIKFAYIYIYIYIYMISICTYFQIDIYIFSDR